MSILSLKSYKTYIPLYEKKKMIKNAGTRGTIDLGIIPGSNILIEYDGILNEYMGDGADDGVWDAISIGNNKECALGMSNSSYIAYRLNGGWGRAANVYGHERHTFGLEGGSNGMTIYVDGNQVWHNDTVIAISTLHSYLFGGYRHPASEIYSGKVYSDGTLYMNLIVGYNLAEEKVGVFDKIHSKFYTSTTAGSYIDLDDRTDSILLKNQTYHVDSQIHGYQDIICIEQEVNE